MLTTHTLLPAKEYTLGFAFNRERVLLIEKNRPSWQQGLLNGVGGKLEDQDEKPVHGMIREFKEETNVDTSVNHWQFICNHFKPGTFDCDPSSYTVFIFAAYLSDAQADAAATTTDEALHWVNLRDINLIDAQLCTGETRSLVPGVDWYIAMCRNVFGREIITTTMEMI